MELNPTIFNNEALINAIYEGRFSVFALPDELFNYNYLNIYAGVGMGFGFVEDLKGERLDVAMKFKKNISEFCGSKSFQTTATLVDSMFTPEGKRVSFSEFKKVAEPILQDFNKNWLKTELNTSYKIAQDAEKWAQIEEEKDIFPLLQYRTVGDGRVRPEHASWNGIIKPVGDPFWDTRYPQNDWGCRCEVVQIREGQITKRNGDKNTSAVFANNPYKSGEVFTKEHDYFDVPNEFKKAQKNNFGFETPTDKEVKEHIKKVKK
ncbi:MAG: Flavobacterium phage vB FspM pippi8 [Bacteroidota bacterium]|jgi:SPP1 gp7 family putative phage head morphogenesis protein